MANGRPRRRVNRNIASRLASRELGGSRNTRRAQNIRLRAVNTRYRAMGRIARVLPRRAQAARRRVYNRGVVQGRWNTPQQYRAITGSTYRG